MSESLSLSLTAQLSALLANPSALDSPQDYLYLPQLINVSLASGTGAGQANQLFRTQRTLAGSAVDSVSVYNFAFNGGAAGSDPLGEALAMLHVKMIIVQNLAPAESDELQLFGDGTSAAWTSPVGSNTDLVQLYGGASLVLFDTIGVGYPVVSPTNHLLKIHNVGSASVTYNLIVVGTTT